MFFICKMIIFWLKLLFSCPIQYIVAAAGENRDQSDSIAGEQAFSVLYFYSEICFGYCLVDPYVFQLL